MNPALQNDASIRDFSYVDGSHAYRDWLGIAASVLCAIHCAAMPFVVGFLPLLGLSFLAESSFHKWMVGVCLVIAFLAFVPGWRRHRRLLPALIGLCGLILISIAAFAGPSDCCPQPADIVTVPGESDAFMQVSIVVPSDEGCASSCCTDGDEPVGSTASESSPPVFLIERDGTCTSPCCAADDDGSSLSSSQSSQATVADGEGVDAESCCPTDHAAVETSNASASSIWWLLMTPLGGLFLVAGHLCNHLHSCHRSSDCCSMVASDSCLVEANSIESSK